MTANEGGRGNSPSLSRTEAEMLSACDGWLARIERMQVLATTLEQELLALVREMSAG